MLQNCCRSRHHFRAISISSSVCRCSN
jgi:hypothetical protein